MHTSQLADGLQRQGIRVDVLTARRGLTGRETGESHGCALTSYPAWRIPSMSVSPRLLWAALRKRRTAELVHVHSYHTTAALAVLGSGAPTVFTPHYHGKRGHSAAANVLHIGFSQLGKLLLRRADAVICVSHAERSLLVRDFPFVADRVVVIPNGAETQAIRAAQPYSDQPPTVVCVSRLEPYKGVADVIRACAELDPPAQLVVIGDGSQRAELASLITDLGVEGRVKLMGRVGDATLHRWLRTARVFVSMSHREAFGMAPLEAACAGARVVLSDIPAHREIIADYLGERAVVATDRSSSELASEIRRQLTADTTVPVHIPDWADITARTLGVYAAVVDGRAANPPRSQSSALKK